MAELYVQAEGVDLRVNRDRYVKTLSRAILFFVYDFCGFRQIWEKVLPPLGPEGRRKPSSFIFWITGLYVALFGVASQHYANHIHQIENRANWIISQLATDSKQYVLSRIPDVQKMTVPRKPELLDFLSPFYSLFGPQHHYRDVVNILKEVLVGNKRSLKGLNLSGVDLEGADLREAIIKEAYLDGANLAHANLTSVNLWETNLTSATLTYAVLDNAGLGHTFLANATMEGASMKGAHVVHANFTSTMMKNANLEGASFYASDFTNSDGLTVEQICRCKRFEKIVGIQEPLLKGIESGCPQILQGPDQ